MSKKNGRLGLSSVYLTPRSDSRGSVRSRSAYTASNSAPVS